MEGPLLLECLHPPFLHNHDCCLEARADAAADRSLRATPREHAGDHVSFGVATREGGRERAGNEVGLEIARELEHDGHVIAWAKDLAPASDGETAVSYSISRGLERLGWAGGHAPDLAGDDAREEPLRDDKRVEPPTFALLSLEDAL